MPRGAVFVAGPRRGDESRGRDGPEVVGGRAGRGCGGGVRIGGSGEDAEGDAERLRARRRVVFGAEGVRGDEGDVVGVSRDRTAIGGGTPGGRRTPTTCSRASPGAIVVSVATVPAGDRATYRSPGASAPSPPPPREDGDAPTRGPGARRRATPRPRRARARTRTRTPRRASGRRATSEGGCRSPSRGSPRPRRAGPRGDAARTRATGRAWRRGERARTRRRGATDCGGGTTTFWKRWADSSFSTSNVIIIIVRFFIRPGRVRSSSHTWGRARRDGRVRRARRDRA